MIGLVSGAMIVLLFGYMVLTLMVGVFNPGQNKLELLATLGGLVGAAFVYAFIEYAVAHQ